MLQRSEQEAARRRAEQPAKHTAGKRSQRAALAVLSALALYGCVLFTPASGPATPKQPPPAAAATEPTTPQPSEASAADPALQQLTAATPSANLVRGSYDLVLTGSNTIGGVDPSTQRGLARDLIVAFCKNQWPGGALLEDTIVQLSGAEAEHVISYKLPTGDVRRILVRPHGSRTAAAALLSADPAQRADIGMSSSPRPELLRGFNEYVVALDAVAIIANPENPVDELTLQELAEIFGPNPTRTDWGGRLGQVHTFGRDKKSGTSELLRAFAGIDASLRAAGQPADAPIAFTGVPAGQAGAEGFEDTATVIERVSGDLAGIGFVGRAANLPVDRVKPLAIRPNAGYPAFVPTPTTIRTMEYAMTRPLYLYTAARPKSLVSDFIRFSLSDPGQAVADEAGFVGFHSSNLLAPAQIGKEAPESLRRAVADSDRVLISFRFRHGVADALDSFSARNLPRLADVLRLPGNSARRLLIVGYVDGSGTKEANLKVSQDRAKHFAELLQRQGITNRIDGTLGFGSNYLLYDDKGDPTSREAQLNRRVDVYLRR